MTQTRGRKTFALSHSGGVVRELAQADVLQALERAGQPTDAALVEILTRILNDRLISVDAPPALTRGQERHLEKIERAAASLMDALQGYDHWTDLSLSVSDDLFADEGRMDSDRTLYRWLVRLADVRGRYFETYDPTHRYRATIRQLRDEILAAGGNGAVYDGSRFVAFLTEVERLAPGVIFPVETVSTGRVRYTERAVTERSPLSTKNPV